MMFYSLIPFIGLISLAFAERAPRSRDSPRGALYRATFTRGISGTLTFSSRNGYVAVNVNLAGLPRTGGPFMYHVHERRVATPGDCASTMGHFNPYNGVLHASDPALAEVGDLSGKYGMIPGTSYRRNYVDQFLSLNPRNRAFFGDLSIVVHLNDGTRIACTNIVRVRGPAALNDGGAPAQLVAANGTEVDGVSEVAAGSIQETGMPLNIGTNFTEPMGEVMGEKMGEEMGEEMGDETAGNVGSAQITDAPSHDGTQPGDMTIGLPFAAGTEVMMQA